MTDIELLPLPEWLLDGFTDPTIEMLCDYTRANVEHYVKELQEEVARARGLWGDAETHCHKLYAQNAAKDAVIEALRAEVERLQAGLDTRWATGEHTCHDKCQRIACVLRRDNKRLAEALRAERRWWVDRKADAIREQVGGLTRGDPGAIARCDAAIQRIDAALAQQPAACAGCEGKPAPENSPCAVCGQQPTTSHTCRNCLGIAPDSCMFNQQPAAVDGDNPYPAPRNRQEAAALARLALAYLGATSAHIEAAVARCETDLAAQQGEKS